MNRRRALKTLSVAGVAAAAPGAAKDPIQLHVDLDVVPTKQKDLAKAFHEVFKPTISRQPGFVEVKLLKLKHAVIGQPPANWNYRLLISFQTEEQRQTWVATSDHQRVWPEIEKHLRGAKSGALLYDVI